MYILYHNVYEMNFTSAAQCIAEFNPQKKNDKSKLRVRAFLRIVIYSKI